MNFETELLVVLFAILLIWLLVRSKTEGFDATGREFVPVGYPRYGLRGDLLHVKPISTEYIERYPNVRLSSTDVDMYESNTPPGDEGVVGCKRVDCPDTVDKYFQGDKCWTCEDNSFAKMTIPDIQPHVKN